jgi:hypothetical protein
LTTDMIRPRSDLNFLSLLGQKVTEVNRMYPILIFEDGSLTIECPWRLRSGNRIIVGEPESQIEDKKEQAYKEFEKQLINNAILK